MNLADVNKKRLVLRIALIILLIAFGFALFYIGKEHEVLFDNKSVEINGKSYKAAEYMKVTIDGKEDKSMEFYADDRDVMKMSGPEHSIKVEIIDEDTEKVIKSAERSFNFGTSSTLLISLPALAENAPDVYLPLPTGMTQQQAENTATEVETGITEGPSTSE